MTRRWLVDSRDLVWAVAGLVVGVGLWVVLLAAGAVDLDGVEPIEFTPRPVPTAATDPTSEGVVLGGAVCVVRVYAPDGGWSPGPCDEELVL